jgi:hypothetical protein
MRRQWGWLLLLLVWLPGLLWALQGQAEDSVSGGQHGPAGVACSHCHADPHAGTGGSACQDCHGTEQWSPPLFTVEQHRETAFPLEGRHQRVACGLCHVQTAAVSVAEGGGASGASIIPLKGLPMECAGCHVDRHRGKLGLQCDECHAPTGFKPVLIDFDHAARTGFALTGPHALGEQLTCDSCHQGDNGRAMRVVQDATCATCHTPAHGDFSVEGDCATCHTPERETFAGALFDHQRQTAFPLERRHSSLGCEDCHAPGTSIPDDRCQTCHTDVHAGQLGTSCTDCHRPDRWRVVRFDHDRTLFSLRGRHFVTPCTSCHTNQRWVGLRTDCWDCHALDLRQAPASVPAHNQGLADCGACHQPWSFRF